MLTASEEATTRVAKILEENPGKVLRVSIQGGGCSGFRYNFDLDSREDDDIIVAEGIVTDMISSAYLGNAVLEFNEDIFMSSFILRNPDVKTTCGCGESFGF